MSLKEQLPQSWKLMPLMDYVHWVKTGVTDFDGEKRYFSTSSIKNGVLKQEEGNFTFESRPSRANRQVKNGDVLQARMASTNKAFLCKNDVSEELFSTGFIQIRSYISSNALSKYLFYYLNSDFFLDQRDKFATGSTQVALTDTGAKKIEIAIAPESEQSRIVEKLDELLSELDSGEEELKIARLKLVNYRHSLLKNAIEGELTASWRESNKGIVEETGEQLLQRTLTERKQRWEQNKLKEFKEKGKRPPKDWKNKYPEPIQPDTSRLPKLPIGWAWASIEQLASDDKYSLAIGPFGSNLKVSDYTEDGVPLVFVRNIRSGNYGKGVTKFISEKKAIELAAHKVTGNDVVVTKMGEPPGDADVFPKDQLDSVITADCIKITCQESLIIPELLKNAINSLLGKKQIQPITKGVAQKKVSLGRFSALAFPVPPMLEQKVITTILGSKVEELERQLVSIDIGIKQAHAQRKNILQAAFRGQLLPQNSSDEPISVLLEKIEKERDTLANLVKPQTSRSLKKKVNVMDTLLDVLKSEDKWFDAQEAFKKCGIVDNTSTDRIEEIYTELRKLEKEGQIEVKRMGNYDQLKLIKKNVKED